MSAANSRGRPAGEGKGRTTRVYVFEESDSGIVPMNHSNNSGRPPAESEEGRPLIEENTHQSSTLLTRSKARVSQGLAGVRRAARERKEMRFTALLHHMTASLLRDSFYALKRKAAPGVDGITWQEYETGLEGRLADLHSRVHRGAYRAQPSRRVYIPKPDGRQRPLGVAALEDKIVQQAVVTILNQIYEGDFRGFSYGFRPGRSQHQALDALYVAITRTKVNWILDCDIKGFDNLSHDWLLKFVEHRVADRRILRLIQKWLKAGVMEEGEWKDTEMGTPLVMDNYGTHKVTKVRTWLTRHPRYKVHFTPTSGSWLNLVERLFAEVTERCVRRGSHTAVRSLEKAMLDYLDQRNKDPKPFVWTADADLILGKVARLSKRISDSGH